MLSKKINEYIIGLLGITLVIAVAVGVMFIKDANVMWMFVTFFVLWIVVAFLQTKIPYEEITIQFYNYRKQRRKTIKKKKRMKSYMISINNMNCFLKEQQRLEEQRISTKRLEDARVERENHFVEFVGQIDELIKENSETEDLEKIILMIQHSDFKDELTNKIVSIKTKIQEIQIQKQREVTETSIIEISNLYQRMQVAEIMEFSGVNDEPLVIDIIKSLIQKNRIKARYFESTKNVIFEFLQEGGLEKEFEQWSNKSNKI